MEIEKIVSTVQDKIGNTDFSTQTIQKYVELNPVADGQEPDEAYYTKAVSFLQGMQGQYNHDFSVKFAEAKKNLLTEDTFRDMTAEQLAEVRKLFDGIKPQEKPKTDDNDEVKALKEQLAAITERLDGNDKARKQADMLQKLKAAMKEQKANDEYVLENTLKGETFDLTKSVEDLTREYLAKYDAEYTKCRGAGTPPRQNAPSSGEATTWLDEQFAKKKAKEGWGRQ